MSYNPNSAGVPQLARAASRLATNNTGGSVSKATPVRITSLGLALIDVSNELEANAIAGVVRSSIANASTGEIVSSGLLEDITTTSPIGSVLYIDKTGALTDTKPTIGVGGFVAGDWVVKIGVVAINQANPSLKDLLVTLQVIGQL